jgi:uncharacterized protein
MATTTPAHIHHIANETQLPPHAIAATAQLLDDGATVPFIARYRKEATGTLDEVQITTIRDRLEQLRELDARKTTILKTLQDNNHLTPQLRATIERATTLTHLEDLYAPYRPKRRTRATIARERGLEPLATHILTNPHSDPTPTAAQFIDPAKEIPDTTTALAGARDIIAEHISDDPATRHACRQLYHTHAQLTTTLVPGKETQGAKYKDYFQWSEPLATAPSHRILAIRRAEKEGILYQRITVPEEHAHAILEQLHLPPPPKKTPAPPPENTATTHIRNAAHDAWKRLLAPTLETEARLASKKRADEEAIRIFAANIHQLLLAPPLGPKTTLALDPGYRTGCKLTILDPQGQLLHHEVIHPTTGSPPQLAHATARVHTLCTQHQVQAIAIGNGTASRETESFIRALKLPPHIVIATISESGASIYSASETAREEFPDHDLTVRSSISIGRRLQDPLAELVKLDPKNIGVGQYQHDVDQTALKRSLDDTVTSCVNHVGVELNTASPQLLGYVSGLNPATAANIVSWRNTHGPFQTREDLRQVPRLGPKAYEQSAGFLRLRTSPNPLDATAVHPERYPLVEQMARDTGVPLPALLHDPRARARIDLQRYITPNVGLPTLQDILKELEKPGRDPREKFEPTPYAENVRTLQDLKEGQRLPGHITNITAFGAFVDIGVHQDGLLHISQMSDTYVKDPAQIVQVGQKVTVTILEIDLPRKRISLTLRTNPPKNPKPIHANPQKTTHTPAPTPFNNNPFDTLANKFKTKP